jgi:hypothetical protein
MTVAGLLFVFAGGAQLALAIAWGNPLLGIASALCLTVGGYMVALGRR